MMVPMMLPSLIPMLWRYRKTVGGASVARLNWLTALAGAGYFSVWTVLGVAVFPLTVALAAIEMHQPALARVMPIAAGVVVLFAGVVQFTPWKARRLACCRAFAHGRVSASYGETWRDGVRLGLRCASCCSNLMAISVVAGIMDLRVMAAVTLAVTIERLTPFGERVARAVGLVAVGVAMLIVLKGSRSLFGA